MCYNAGAFLNTYMPRISLFGFLALFLVAPVLADEIPSSFSDTPGTPASTAVQFLKTAGVVEGFADGTFLPDKSITRAEFLKIALKSKSEVEADCVSAKKFSDVSADDWFAPYVCQAVNEKIIEGYTDGTFRPHDSINFRDAAKIVGKIYAIETTESATGEWYVPYTDAILRERVLPGTVSDSAKLLSRGEMAQMIWGIKTGNEVENQTLGDLPTISSCLDLEAQLRKYETRNASSGAANQRALDFSGVGMLEAGVAESAGAVPPMATADKSAGAGDFSETNVQEQGVDEADIVKNDGSDIFLVKNDKIRIVRAVPADQLQEIASISLAAEGVTPSEIFLDGDRLTVIGISYGGFYKGDMPIEPMMDERIGIMPPYWGGGQKTGIIVYDISNRADPKKTRSVTLDGRYLSSRRIDGNVFVAVSRDNPIWGIPRPFDPIPFLPVISDSAFPDTTNPVKCADFRYVPNFTSPNSLIVVGVPTRDDSKKVSREVVLGGGENVYASLQNLFVTRTNWGERYFEKDGNISWRNEEGTEIYRFALNSDAVKFTGKTEADGHVLNQFSMSEQDGYFRIATQSGQGWDQNLSETLVTIFDADLKETGRIDGIAPGENMKSARFLGNKAYLVTFKTVDPLFVIDLDPKNPKVLGKLKIPGWSDYLHPWDENHLIGFGQEVDASIDADKVHSDNAVYYTAVLGMKLSIFDVSDVNNPKEVQKEVIGYRGTTSEVLMNHKALLADPEKGIIAFPVTITENKNGKTGDEADIQTVFSGARIYDVSLENGFKLRGSVSNYDSDEFFKKAGEYFYGDPDLNIARMIYIGDAFYSIAPNVIKALKWDDVAEIKAISLDEKACNEIPTETQCLRRSDCQALYQNSQECTRPFGGEIVCEDAPLFMRCDFAD